MSDFNNDVTELKPPKRKLFWAISSNNLIGMPAQLIYIFTVLGILKHPDYVMADWVIDPSYLPTTFILLTTTAISLALIHNFQVTRMLAPLEQFLELEQEEGLGGHHELARAALETGEYFPFHAFRWSVLYYLVGTPIVVGCITIFYYYSWLQLLSLTLGIWSAGMVISVFMFYATKRALVEYNAHILENYPELLLDQKRSDSSNIESGLKTKFMFAIVILASFMMILTSVAAANVAYRSLQAQAANFYKDRISSQIAEIETKVDSSTPAPRLYSLIQELDRDDEDLVLVLDDQQNNYFGTKLDPRLKRVAQLAFSESAWKVLARDPSVKTLGDDLFDVVMGKDLQYTMVRRQLRIKSAMAPVAGGEVETRVADVLVLISGDRYNRGMTGMYLVIGLGFVIGLGLALFYSKLSSEEISDPLHTLMESLRAMANGDLTQNVTVTSLDEMGVASSSLARAIFGLRRLIGRVGAAVDSLEKASGEIASKSSDVAAGSITQVNEIEESSASMMQMKTSVRGIADSVQTLASSTEESSSSIIEVQATIEEVSNNVDNLSASVVETTASIQQMSTSVGEVADNVQYLTRRAEEAMAALTEVERMIKKVGVGTKDTAAITEEVAAKAEQGAEAVQTTIKGIEKIDEASKDSAKVIGSLGTRAQEIGAILDVINDVTEETNLLALNAAIIAAQAGDHGRGFSVVADEIKDLAERTAASTNEIADLIQAVQDDAVAAVARMKKDSSSIADGVRLSQDAGAALRQIMASVQKAIAHTQEITTAVAVQTEKTSGLMDFMDGVNALIAQVAQATSEQRKTGESILHSAEQMKEITGQVKRATTEQNQGSRQITQAIEHIADIANYINSAQAEQLKSTESMGAAISRIHEIADDNQRRVHSMTTGAGDLKRLAAELHELIDEFRL